MFSISRLRRPADRARESLRQALAEYAPAGGDRDEAPSGPENGQRVPARPRYMYRTNFELVWGSPVER